MRSKTGRRIHRFTVRSKVTDDGSPCGIDPDTGEIVERVVMTMFGDLVFNGSAIDDETGKDVNVASYTLVTMAREGIENDMQLVNEYSGERFRIVGRDPVFNRSGEMELDLVLVD